jgi:predicted transcriptional regulator
MPINLKLDRDLRDRIQRLADTRHQSRVAIIHEAIEQYLQRQDLRSQDQQFQEKSNHAKSRETEEATKHPSGKPWPQRNPVGGIITPV